MRCDDCVVFFSFLFINDTATTAIYTLTLHDALPISRIEAPSQGVLDNVAASFRAAGIRRLQVHGHSDRAGSARSNEDRKSTRLNSSHANISYAVFCLNNKKKKKKCIH